jgi:hypothetical protein
MCTDPGISLGVVIITIFQRPPTCSAKTLLQQLNTFNAHVIRHQPGLRISTLHESVDGTHVAHFTIWDSPEAFKRSMRKPEVQAHMAQAHTFLWDWD